MTKHHIPQEISAALSEHPERVRGQLLAARKMILELSKDVEPGIKIEESLKWGQPSYATSPKTGTPIRLAATKDARAAIFVHCQTTLISDLASDNPHGLATIDNRALVLPDDPETNQGLRSFILSALRYHL